MTKRKKPKEITSIRLSPELKKEAIEQGVNISKATEETLIKILESDFLPHTKNSYLEASKIAKKFKLEGHFELIKDIAIALDKAHCEGYNASV